MARTIVVDGMNVIGSRPDGWWRDRDGAVRRLLGRLQEHGRAVTDHLVLVLDGRPLSDVPEGTHDGVEVKYATRRGRDAADDRIVELVQELEHDDLLVVTSDRDLAARASALGVAVEGAGAFLRRLERG